MPHKHRCRAPPPSVSSPWAVGKLLSHPRASSSGFRTRSDLYHPAEDLERGIPNLTSSHPLPWLRVRWNVSCSSLGILRLFPPLPKECLNLRVWKLRSTKLINKRCQSNYFGRACTTFGPIWFDFDFCHCCEKFWIIEKWWKFNELNSVHWCLQCKEDFCWKKSTVLKYLLSLSIFHFYLWMINFFPSEKWIILYLANFSSGPK